MTQWHGGKGSAQRKVDKQKFSDNWDAIFGKKKEEDKDLKFMTAEDYINNTLEDDSGVLDGSEEEKKA